MIAIFVLLIGIFVFKLGTLNSNAIKIKSNQVDPEFEKYRSLDIPEECRLPEYESDLESWKQHLSHHKQTWYCLDYYGTSIEKLNKGK